LDKYTKEFRYKRNNVKTPLRLTFKIGDVFAARISETAGFAGLQKCGGAKQHKGRSSAKRTPGCCFAEPEPPEQGGERLLFVRRSVALHISLLNYFFYNAIQKY
jgi:hypothetical protein